MNRALTQAEIETQVRKVNKFEEYQDYREIMLKLMDDAREKGQAEYAAFLFAFASVSNKIQGNNKQRKRG